MIMKSTFLITALVILLTSPIFGNDGIYLNRGGLFYPVNETKITLEKESLSFTVRDKVAQVDILFEFNNPENEERKLLVGFQAPTATGDVSDETSNKNQISNFRILKDGELLPYQLKAAGCADCELKDPKDFHFSQGNTGVFVYLFEMTFKPGINKVNHSYSFPASTNVAFNQIYKYILTTGANWANGKINDLTVSMDMGTNNYFYVHDIFGSRANWSVIGVGKVTNQKFNHFDADSCRMVRILSGRLQIEVRDFSPTKNIEFGIINEDSFINNITDFSKIKTGKVLELTRLNPKRTYSREELRLLRNTIYAQHGYIFKDKDLRDYFSQFEWYLPDPNLTMEQIVLTEREKLFVDEILKKEKE